MTTSRAAAVLSVVAILGGILGEGERAEASAHGAVYVHSPASATLRLRVSEGPSNDCDSNLNQMRFDGQILAGETLRVPISGPCVCVSNASAGSPTSDWSVGQRYCGTTPGRRSSRAPSFSVELGGR
jgi:hypothetical protein